MEKSLAAFALTDHDTVDGLEEAIHYAENLKQIRRDKPYTHALKEQDAPASSCRHHDMAFSSAQIPEVIPGIELSTEYQGQDVHILGLYIDYHNPAFRKQLQEFVDSRVIRNQKMCELLQAHGIQITYEALLAEYPGAVITRAHYAKYMLSHGYIQSMKEAFDRYIDDHGPCYVPREKVTPEQAVQMILAADGIPVLAHPTLYHMSDERLDTLTASLKTVGLMAIEAVYSTYNAAEERHIRSLAAKYELLISGGSDFHGANKPGLDLGNGYGKLFIPYSILEKIKKVR